MLCCGKSKEPFSCHVELLDGTHLNFSKNQNIKITTKAHILFDAVCLHLNLIEKDFFGLSYFDNQSQRHWLDPVKALCEDATFMSGSNAPPCVLYFAVKFYAADPCALKEEVTRYQFFLQLKKDILTSKLTCPWKKSAEVSALALQSEIGDYHANEHKRGYVSEFRFLPNQDEKFESEVARLHASFQGLVPASAEMQYLRKCRQFDLYGVEMHTVKGDAGMQYTIGISPRGIETFKNKYRIAVYYWSRIESLDYKDQYLKIEVKNKQGNITAHSFQLRSPNICRLVWKSMVDHHVFYRLPQNIPAENWNKKFRYSGRTEAEILQSEVEREEPEVERGSSKRYPPRLKDNDHENEKENNISKDDHEVDNNDPSWNKVLDKKGMFSVADNQNSSVNYMTPKNERRERNRQLQSMSDNENRNRKHRSHRGKSSGDESDSPSKRRIRSRARHNRSNIGSDVSEVSQGRRRRRKYYTDTEMANGHADHNRERRRQHNDPQSRKNKRLSREDITARQQLWQHIQRDVIDPSDRSPEQLRDIPYTEVKTEGNPVSVKVRHNRRRHSSGKRTSGVSINSYAQALEEGMVSPLPITTTVLQERQRTAYSSAQHRNRTSPSKHPGKDWDTRTSLSVDGFQSHASRSKQHRTRQRRNQTPQKKDPGLTYVYSQI